MHHVQRGADRTDAVARKGERGAKVRVLGQTRARIVGLAGVGVRMN